MSGQDVRGLDDVLDRFASEYLADDPEMLTTLGLPAGAGRAGEATIVTDATVQARIACARRSLAGIETLEPGPDHDRPDVRVLQAYLRGVVAADPFVTMSYPAHDRGELSDLYFAGVPIQAWQRLQRGPVPGRQGALDYISRTMQLPAQLAAVQAATEWRANHDRAAPEPILRAATLRMRAIGEARVPLPPQAAAGLEAVTDATGVERRRLQLILADVLDSEVRPAYRRLADACEKLLPRSPPSCSLALRPNGHAYYSHLVDRVLGQSWDAAALLRLGWAEVERLSDTMLAGLARLGGRPGSLPWDDWADVLARQPAYGGGEARRLALDWIGRASAVMAEVLGAPIPEVALAMLPSGSAEPDGFYEPASFANGGVAVFHLNIADAPQPAAALKTLVHHETVPGHHAQLWAAAVRVPALKPWRTMLPFPGWSEGWATFAESVAIDWGLFEGDDLGALGVRAAELRRAVRLVLDVSIHGEGCPASEARRRVGAKLGSPAWLGNEVARVSARPAEGVAYTTGLHAIRTLQADAGRGMDSREFARHVLRAGPCPLSLLPGLFAASVAVSARTRCG